MTVKPTLLFACIVLTLMMALPSCKPAKASVFTSTHSGSTTIAVQVDLTTTGQRARERWFTKDGETFADLTFWESFPWDGQGIVEVEDVGDFLVISFVNGERQSYHVLENADVLTHRQTLKTTHDGGAYVPITATLEDVDKMPFPDDIIREAVIRTATNHSER